MKWIERGGAAQVGNWEGGGSFRFRFRWRFRKDSDSESREFPDSGRFSSVFFEGKLRSAHRVLSSIIFHNWWLRVWVTFVWVPETDLVRSHNLQLTSPILWPWPLGGDVNDAGRKWWAVLLTSTTLFYSFVTRIWITSTGGNGFWHWVEKDGKEELWAMGLWGMMWQLQRAIAFEPTYQSRTGLPSASE